MSDPIIVIISHTFDFIAFNDVVVVEMVVAAAAAIRVCSKILSLPLDVH